MGANYDVIVLPVDNRHDAEQAIKFFATSNNLNVESISVLDSTEHDNGSVILASPSCNGFVQVLAEASALGIPTAEWFGNNRLAASLSESRKVAVHLWSLDSGFVAGYSAYREGGKVECDVVFSRHAKTIDEILDGVPTPTKRAGCILDSCIFLTQFDFSSYMLASSTLERGMAGIMALLGFQVHLVDFYQAIDELEGTAIHNGDYKNVPLENWTVISVKHI